MLKKRQSRPPGFVVVPARPENDSSSPLDADEPQVRDLRRLHEFTSRMAATRDVGAMFRDVLDSALAVNGARQGIVFLPDPERDGLVAELTAGLSDDMLKHVRFLPRGAGASGRAFADRRRVVVADTESDPLFESFRGVARTGGFRAVHSTPLITREGRLVAVLSIFFPAPHLVSEREMRIIDLYAQQAADLIEGAQLRERLQRELEQREDSDRALRRSEERLRLALASGRIGVWDWDVAKNHVTGSESLYQIHGIAKDDFDGTVEGFLALVHPDDRVRVQERIAYALGGGVPQGIEFRIVRPDGRVVWLFANATVTSEAGRPVRMLGSMLDITALHEADEALRARERLMQLISDAVPALISYVDAGRRYRFCNHAYEVWFNTPSSRVIGHTMQEVLGDAAWSRVRPLIDRAFAGEPIDTEAEVPYATAGTRWVHLVYTPHRDATNRIVGVAIIVSDISNARRLDDERRRLAAIVESSQDAILSKDLTGTVTSWNAAAERLYGFAATEIIGRKVTLLLPEDRLPEEPEILGRVGRGEQIDKYETVRVRKDGSRIDVLLTVSPLKDETGQVVGASTTAHDITDRRRTELALRASEERFRALAGHAPVGIFLSGPDGGCEFVNQTWVRMTGLNADDARGDGWVRALHPGDREKVVTGWRDAVRLGNESALEFRFLRQDGKVTWVQGHAVNFRDAGRFTGFLWTCVDITERKEAELDSAFLQGLSERLGTITGYEELLRTAVEAIGTYLQSDRAYFFEIDSDNFGMINADWHREDLASVAGRYEIAEYGLVKFREMLATTRARIDDVRRHPATLAAADKFEALAIRAFASSAYHHENRWVVTLAATSRAPRKWTDRELGLLENAAARVWPMVQQARTTEALQAANAMAQQRMAALEVLNETGSVLAADHEPERIVQTVTHSSRELARAAWSVLFLNVESSPGSACPLPAVSGIPREALSSFPSREIFFEVFHRGNQVRSDDAPMGEGKFVARSCLGLPVRSRSGRVLGALFLGHPEPRFFSPEASTVIAALAAQAAVAIDNANLYMAFQRELAAMNRLHALNTALVDAHDVSGVLDRLLAATLALTDACCGSVHLLNAGTGRLEIVAQRGLPASLASQFGQCPALEWQKYAAAAGGHTTFNHVEDTVVFAPHREVLEREGIRAVQVTPLLGREGRLVGLLSTHYRDTHRPDVRDLKLLDLFAAHASGFIERARSQELLRAREQQLMLVTDHAPIYLAQCDAQYRFKFVNRTMAERYKLPREAILGRAVPEIAGEEAFKVFRHHMDAALAGSRVEFEEEIPYSTLGHRWVHVLYEPERDPTGAVIGLVAVIVDITGRKQVERELERARDEAVAASRAKDDFLAALSHELRTPLSPVLLLASDYAQNSALPSDIRSSFEMIRSNISLEARLIDDLLDLTRVTRGKMSLEKQHVDVHAVLRDAIAAVQPDAAEKRQRISVSLAAPHSRAMADPVRLQQVFWNVLKNAVKFTPAEGEVLVRTRVQDDENILTAEIVDSGIGMTDAEIARAFDAFAQGDHASPSGPHRFGGLGLGLAISQKLMEMHDGRIRAASEGRNRGSTFTIELPLHMTSNTAGVSPAFSQTPFQAAAGIEDAPRVRLLLVEDHPATRVTLERLLTRRNYVVIPAASATEARALAKATTFDLLVSDVGLPDGDGYQLMTELRTAHPSLPGIALSGYGMEDDLRRSQAAGFSAHLVKPVSMGALERAITSLVRK